MSTLTETIAAPTRGLDDVTTGLLARLKSFFAAKPASETDPIEDFIQANGGVLTDQLERDISRRFGSMVGH